MPDPIIEIPVPIGVIDPTGLSTADPQTAELYTIAAFLLLCGKLHFTEFRERPIVEPEDMEAIGLANWNPETLASDQYPIEPGELSAVVREILEAPFATGDVYFRLYQAVQAAIETGSFGNSLLSVMIGLQAPHSIVRACALRSALELVRLPLGRALDLFGGLASGGFDDSDTAATIAAMALAAAFGIQPFGFGSVPSIDRPKMNTEQIPVLPIHGTNFIGSRPDWSVPPSGSLYKYLKANRQGTVDADRYFRWEGGYSSYAREVAAQNLANWLVAKGMQGCSAVCHSHGCNVLNLSTHSDARYDKVVLLSCPVHWRKYRPMPGSIKSVHSVRVNLDLVIIADGGAQRFPSGTVPELVLPWWLAGHGKTTEVMIWKRYNLLQFI